LYVIVNHLFSSLFIRYLSALTLPQAQIYFVFLCVGNPKTALKGGYLGRRGGSSFASLWRVGSRGLAKELTAVCGV
jgi:hypothetical protein